eukprot:5951751-Ditylum_brightwellii.AAC.1
MADPIKTSKWKETEKEDENPLKSGTLAKCFQGKFTCDILNPNKQRRTLTLTSSGKVTQVHMLKHSKLAHGDCIPWTGCISYFPPWTTSKKGPNLHQN